jgi:hypothetical protein
MLLRKMGAEELEGALGAKGSPGDFAKDRGPAQIEGGAVDGFLIRAAGFVLEKGEKSQLGGRNAGAAGAIGVEGGKVGIVEEARSGGGKLSVEALGMEFQGEDVADIEEIALGLALSEHPVSPLASGLPRDRFDIKEANSLVSFDRRGRTFRPRF